MVEQKIISGQFLNRFGLLWCVEGKRWFKAIAGFTVVDIDLQGQYFEHYDCVMVDTL